MMETLKKGMSNPSVAVAKYLIHYAEIKEATEEFDDEFFGAVKEYQEEHSLVADGVIGANTWRFIVDKLPTTSTTKNRKSRETCALQILLGAKVDGIFGAKTKTAVKEYQKNNGLTDDGIVGANTWKMLILGENAAEDKNINISRMKQPPNLKQYSKPWGPKMYSNHNDKKQTYSNSACGVLSIVMVCRGLFDKDLGVEETGNLSVEKGYRTYNSGTNPGLFKYLANKYQSAKYQITNKFDNVIKCLETGGLVIVCFGPGLNCRWTKSGHYCVIWKYDGKYVRINDPASTKENREKATKEDVIKCKKGFYCIYPKEE